MDSNEKKPRRPRIGENKSPIEGTTGDNRHFEKVDYNPDSTADREGQQHRPYQQRPYQQRQGGYNPRLGAQLLQGPHLALQPLEEERGAELRPVQGIECGEVAAAGRPFGRGLGPQPLQKALPPFAERRGTLRGLSVQFLFHAPKAG